MICGSDSFPYVDSLDEVEVGEGQEDLADDVVPLGRSIEILNFEHQRSLEHLPVGQLVSETLIEHRILRLALHRRLPAIALIRQQIHPHVSVTTTNRIYTE